MMISILLPLLIGFIAMRLLRLLDDLFHHLRGECLFDIVRYRLYAKFSPARVGKVVMLRQGDPDYITYRLTLLNFIDMALDGQRSNLLGDNKVVTLDEVIDLSFLLEKSFRRQILDRTLDCLQYEFKVKPQKLSIGLQLQLKEFSFIAFPALNVPPGYVEAMRKIAS